MKNLGQIFGDTLFYYDLGVILWNDPAASTSGSNIFMSTIA